MTKTPRSRIRVRGIAELIAVLPHQLGYQPRQSLVAVVLERPRGKADPGSGTVGMSARVDLPPAEHADELAGQLVEVFAREQAYAVELLAFTDERDDPSARAALLVLARACTDAAIRVHHAVQVCSGSWCAVTGEGAADLNWCPVPEAADVPAVADYVLTGASPLADREDYGRALDAEHLLTQQAVAAGLAAQARADGGLFLPVSPEEAAAVWATVLRTGGGSAPIGGLTAADLVVLVRSLWDTDLRDAILTVVAPAQFESLPVRARAAVEEALGPEPVDLGEMTDRLVELCSRLPRELAAPALTVLGVHAWAKGDGTLANVAVERALRQEPGYRMATLLDHALQHLIRPRRFRREGAA